MNRLERLIAELNTLPKGYISKKKIRGKIYHYLQYTENGELKSEYIKSTELQGLITDLNRRHEIESQISDYYSNGRDINVLKKRAREFTGSIMMEDTEVARFITGVCVYKDDRLCPLFIKRTSNISAYLESRAIDRNRTNARLLKKVLNISDNDDAVISLYAYGASITDNYWFKVSGSKLRYKDIAFQYDYYNDIALKGEILLYPKSPKHSPQLTLTGSYEKCWKRDDEIWWLYKRGSEDEIFSELFCTKLAKVLRIPTAVYEQDGDYIRTRNFAEASNFEPMTSIAGDDDSYENVFQALLNISPKLARQYLRLIWFDALVNNVDRHNENCGIMRDKKTGQILSLAPNFDNNLALISRSRTLNLDAAKDGFIKQFLKFVNKNSLAKKYYQKMTCPKLDEVTIAHCLSSIAIKREDVPVAQYVLGRYHYLYAILFRK